jgi:Zn-dependent protease
MRLSWKMGRVAGIDLYIHATFLFVFLYMGDFGHGSARAIASLFLICSVFGSVLLHEFGHALTARRFGIGTVDITLYPIGGVARLQRMPRAPGAELLITLAGPAVNFAIATVVFALLLVGGVFLDLSWSFDSFLGQLLIINLGLGLFNLIPAFPMDGGRVLRAVLSTRLGRARATRIASTVGQILAVVLVLLGMVSTGSLNPMHLVLAGFIFFAARSEEAHVVYEEQARAVAQGSTAKGMWVAPPGYRWVDRGNGLWQLAPLGVSFPDQATRDASAWRR